MAELGTVYVDIEGKWDDFGKQTQSKFGAVAKGAAAAFAGAFVVKEAFDFGKQAVDAASNVTESVNAVQKSFDSVNSQKLLQVGQDAATSMGMSEGAFNSFAVSMAGFANAAVGAGGDAAGAVNDLGVRVADFASVMNLDVAEASSVFRQALAGESEGMKRFGKDVSDAAVKQYALAEGLWDGAEPMDAQTLAAARLGNLMAQTANTSGDFAETSGELANSQRIAAAEMENMKAELGTALLPVLKEIMPIVREQLIPLIGQLAPVFGAVGSVIAELAPPVSDLIGMLLPLVVDILTPLLPLIGEIAGAFIELIGPIIRLVSTALKPLISIVLRIAGDLLDALAPALDALIPLFVALTPLITLLLNLLRPLLPIIELAAKLIGAVLGVAVQLLTKLIFRLVEELRPLLDWTTKLARSLEEGLAKILPALLQWFRELPGKITAFLRNAKEWLVGAGGDLIRGFIDGIKRVAGNIISTIKKFVTDKIPSFVKDALGIGSPSKVMRALGADTSLGFARGLLDSRSAIDRAMNRILPTPAFGVSGYGASASVTGPVAMTFNGPVGGDLGLFSQQVMEAAAREQRYANG